MKIEAVEAARIPMVMARVGEMGGFFCGSDKLLSGFFDVPEYFANQPTLRDGAKVTTVGAFRVRSDNEDFP